MKNYIITFFWVISAFFIACLSEVFFITVAERVISGYRHGSTIFYMFDSYSFTVLAATHFAMAWVITRKCSFIINAKVSLGVLLVSWICYFYVQYKYISDYGYILWFWIAFYVSFHYTVYVLMLFTVVRYFIRKEQKGIEKGNGEGNERH